ncbi:Flocculation protein [Citrus sinensis]|uniref:Flocculation protein n=1 Tax=Citrus sinensis TaxID=2711 RepID=A0ACB8P1F8_CITSI|nr:Flocculation protein [Citrus sinensis]
MSNKNRSRGGDDGGFRVTIPAHVRPLIQSIRETTGKQHGDEEIYSVLQDCSMDPNETAQKLLYLVAGGGRNAASRRENGVNHLTERGAIPRKTKINAVPHGTKALIAMPNGSSSLSNGSLNNGHDPQLIVDGMVPEPQNSTAVDAKKFGTKPLPPTPTFASIIGVAPEKSMSSSSHLPTSTSSSSVSGVYSSASDPVLASPVSWNAGAVGTIVREVGSNRKAAEPNHIQGNKDDSYDVDKESSKSEKKASNTPKSIQKKIDSNSEEVEKNQLSQESLSLSTLDGTLSVHSSVNDSLPAQESIALPKVVTSADASVAIKANPQLLPESTVSDNQHVTFPNHFKFSEAVKNGLTFGSIDASFGLATKYVNGTSGEINSVAAIEYSCGSDETAEESSTSQSVPSTTQGETLDHPQTPPLVDKVPSTVGDVQIDTELKHDESKQEMPLLPEGQQKSTVLSVANYSYGFVLPSPGSQLVQMEGLEAHARDASLVSNFANGNSLAPISSPAPSVQSSVVAPPPPVQIFRHPFPSFLPYGQYLSPYFMPHQFLSPNGLPQQPSTGNLYLPSAAAAAGVKFPLSQFKAGTNAGNPPHIGIASGYGSYGSSPVGGFNPITSGTSGKSTSNEDLAASQLKDNHIYTTRPLSDGSVYITAPGQDLSNMQLNPLYNLTLQGQHIAFAPQTSHGAFPGVYQSAQTLAAPSNVNPLLQQTQAMTAAVDTMGPPSGAYQQPQLAQMNWNPSY